MLTFKNFMEHNEEDKNILQTLSKIPPSHAALVKGYTFKFQGGNTLDGDDDHIGYMQKDPKVIAVAAPWNYGREFTVLHEIGHRVYEKMPASIKHRWHQLVSNTPNRHKNDLDTDPEELFCMSYAQYYAKNKMSKYNFPEWVEFISHLPK